MGNSRRELEKKSRDGRGKAAASLTVHCATQQFPQPAQCQSWLVPGDSEVSVPAECPGTNWEVQGALGKE